MKDTVYAAKKRHKRQRALRKRRPRRQGSRAVIGRRLPALSSLPNPLLRKGRDDAWPMCRFPRI